MALFLYFSHLKVCLRARVSRPEPCYGEDAPETGGCPLAAERVCLLTRTQAADLLQEARDAVPGSAKLPRGHEASSGGSGLNREQKAWLEQWVWTRGPLVNVTRGGGGVR